MRLDGSGYATSKNKAERILLHTHLLTAAFGLATATTKRIKKARKTKSWQLPNVSLPGLRLISQSNEQINKKRIDDLERMIDQKEQSADEYYLAGRPGKAIKMMKRRRANLRELSRLDSGRAAAIRNRKAV